jgi:uncharacterized membrane protein
MAKPTIGATHRLETFSDSVFAISATLLVVSLEVPQDFESLKQSLAGFIAFAASFSIFINIWVHHHRYFKAFPLADAGNIALNSLLLFVVLFFVYPLKFLMIAFTKWVTGIGTMTRLTPDELDALFAVYGAGWMAVFLCFAAMYWRAGRAHALLELTPTERATATLEAEFALAFAAVGLVSLVFALAGLSYWYGLPGFVYSLCGFVGWWYGRRWQGRLATLTQRYSA